jgi:hypothetical protein
MMNMTSTEHRQTDAGDHAASIARWDDEGGAATSRLSTTDGKPVSIPEDQVGQAFAGKRRQKNTGIPGG